MANHDSYRVDLDQLDQATARVAGLQGFVEDSLSGLEMRIFRYQGICDRHTNGIGLPRDDPVAGTGLPTQFAPAESPRNGHETCANRIAIRTSTGRHRPTNSNNQQPATPTNNQEPPGRTRSPDETRRSKVASKDAIDSQTDWRSCSFGLFLRIATNAKPAVGRHFDTTKPRFQISWSPICVDLQNVDRTSRNHWPPRVLESPTETERKGGSRPPPNRATALPGLPRVRLTRECGVSGRECGLVYCLKLDRGEFPEAALPTLAVVGAFDP
jgi:hypothetical protein